MPFDKRALGEAIEGVLYKDRHYLRKRLSSLPPADDKRFAEQHNRLKERLIRSQDLVRERKSSIPELSYPAELPITRFKEEICDAIRAHQVVVITGETGSGKTTQIPKMCLEAGRGIFGKIACTQPRRIAATSLSAQVAKEMNSPVGETVGFRIRFADKAQASTLIQFVTDGLLLAEIQGDRFLTEYDTIVIDEAHERTLNIDFLLGYLKQLLVKRPELKLIITSATIDIEKFSGAFPQYYSPRQESYLLGDPSTSQETTFKHAPIVSVSGRMYPVEVRYFPIDEVKEEQGDLTIIDLVQEAVEDLLTETDFGDILVFMSGIQEIREAYDCFSYLNQEGFSVLPLFGRLTNAEQNQIFKKSAQRRVILSTNIAETSITVPGIHYVVDTGRARISQYNTRTGTQGLPIKAISQSSADQRKGRCGRISNGICIRLYSEEDYLNRETYTTPEIQRANLSEVILRLLALRLGNIETFPFIDPPEAAQIRAGFRTLQELGALTTKKKLTPAGKELAALPVDPRTARMILQANHEKAVYPVLIIASAISCQDPRERPEDKKTQAAQKHARFKSRESDLISMLNIWEAYHATLESLKTQGKMRKFCKANFLSYNRIREWRDIHSQLSAIAEEKKWQRQRPDSFDYDAIHKSILAGYLPHIAKQKEKKIYQGTKNREFLLFPGSDQYQSRHQWIVAIELIETAKLYAHTVARINPDWLEDLAGNLCKRSWSEPHWDKKSQRVTATEKVTLFGFCLVDDRKVFYGKIDREEANRIFIREALVEGRFESDLPFWKHNRKLIRQIEAEEAKIRSKALLVDDSAIESFYEKRISQVACLDDLKKLIKRHGGDTFLFMTKEDLLRKESADNEQLFPSYLQVGETRCKLTYRFEPGHPCDGITIHIPRRLLGSVREEAFETLVPGLLKEKIFWLLKSQPKEVRKKLVPIPEKAEKIWDEMTSLHYSTAATETPAQHFDDFYRHLSDSTFRVTRVHIEPEEWNKHEIPDYLRINFACRKPEGKGLLYSRELTTLINPMEKPEDDWEKRIKSYQRWGIQTWDFDELMKRVELTGESDIPIWGYNTLRVNDQELMVTVMKSEKEALETCLLAVPRLIELQLGDRLAWLHSELRFPPECLTRLQNLWKTAGHASLDALMKKYDSQKAQAQRKFHAQVQQSAYEMVHRGLCGFDGEPVLSQEAFQRRVENARATLENLGPKVVGWINDSLEMLHQVFAYLAQHQLTIDQGFHTRIKNELDLFFSPSCLKEIPLSQWKHCPRILKCYKKRIERHLINPHVEKSRYETIETYQLKAQALAAKKRCGAQQNWIYQNYCWMLEELKVSVFAQELSTAFPISIKRIEKFIDAYQI